MHERRIIACAFFVAAVANTSLRQPVASGQAPEQVWPSGPYLMQPAQEDCSQPKPVLIEPQQQMWVQPAAPMEMVPIMPLPESAGPRPGTMVGPMMSPTPGTAPGTMFGGPPPMPGTIYPPGAYPPAEAGSPAGPLENIAPGGAISPQFGLPAAPQGAPAFANPIMVPATDDQLAWEQIASVVSDYFTISREQQVRRSGEAWCEGRIETAYQGGATWLEPFRKDSVGAFNRWESTFQTIRRKALVRVIPEANGFLVEVIVDKEIEDLPQPERAMAGAAAFRFDQSLPSDRAGEVGRTTSSTRWLPLGRDPALEAKMLADIHARLNGVTTAAASSMWPSVWP